MVDTVLTNADVETMNSMVEEIETNVRYYTDISDRIINQYTSDFDELMRDLKRDIIENEPTDLLLEKYLLELNNMLYFLGSKLESVGIKDDLSKLSAKEVFNEAYLASREKDAERKNKTTVAELTAIADDASKYETVLNSIYSRVYKQIKFKMDAGYDMVNSLRKIISRRMQEASLAYYNPSIPINSNEGESYR